MRGQEVRPAAARAGTVLAALLSAGCYSYAPADFAAVPIGEGVRVYLTQGGVAHLQEVGGDALPGLADRPVLVGRLVGKDAGAFSLQVPVATRQVGFHSAALDQRVTLPIA